MAFLFPLPSSSNIDKNAKGILFFSFRKQTLESIVFTKNFSPGTGSFG